MISLVLNVICDSTNQIEIVTMSQAAFSKGQPLILYYCHVDTSGNINIGIRHFAEDANYVTTIARMTGRKLPNAHMH